MKDKHKPKFDNGKKEKDYIDFTNLSIIDSIKYACNLYIEPLRSIINFFKRKVK